MPKPASDILSSITLGNGLVESRQFNDQRQETQLLAMRGGSRYLELDTYYCANLGSSCADNTGNILGELISFDTVGGAAAFGAVQTLVRQKNLWVSSGSGSLPSV